jgi:hypothetical protein
MPDLIEGAQVSTSMRQLKAMRGISGDRSKSEGFAASFAALRGFSCPESLSARTSEMPGTASFQAAERALLLQRFACWCPLTCRLALWERFPLLGLLANQPFDFLGRKRTSARDLSWRRKNAPPGGRALGAKHEPQSSTSAYHRCTAAASVRVAPLL